MDAKGRNRVRMPRHAYLWCTEMSKAVCCFAEIESFAISTVPTVFFAKRQYALHCHVDHGNGARR